MGRVLLVTRLAARDLRRRPAQAVLLLLAITAATATLTLALALNGVTQQPYQQTRAATHGPDVVAMIFGFNPIPRVTQAIPAATIRSETEGLVHARGVTGHSGPYPVASVVLRSRGRTVPVEAEGRSQAPAPIEQPAVTAGRWVRPGGVVLERTFADALGVGVGDRVTLNGRPFTVTGIAVTAAGLPYPNLCYSPGGNCVFDLASPPAPAAASTGFAWVTEPDARALASRAAPLSYFLNLKLSDPARAEAFASGYGSTGPGSRHRPAAFDQPDLIPWQQIASGAGLLVQDEQQVLEPGALLAGLLAVASVAVLAGGRMSEQTRRVGLLKAVGSTPGLVSVVLLAENLVLALAAAAAGLAVGWLAAPLITSPGAGLVGTPGAPAMTPAMAGLVVAAALAVAVAATLVPAMRAARASTVRALADAARVPRRRATLISISARLPVPWLLGLRLAARRPRRAALSTASIAVTVTGIVAALAVHATAHEKRFTGPAGIGDPVASRDEQMVAVLTVVLITLAVLNAILTAWATALDARGTSALAQALGASPQQVSTGVSAAQVLSALPGALLGVPLGIGLFTVANGAGITTIPPAWWLAATVLGTLAAVAVLAAIPARLSARRPPGEILQAEFA